MGSICNMDIFLCTLFFKDPQKRGRWTTFPFTENARLVTPKVRVLQNCLGRSTTRGVKNIALGVGPDAESFIDDLRKLESFVALGIPAMYPSWFNNTMNQSFVSMLKPSGEMRVNIVHEVEIVDEDENKIDPSDLELGSFVHVELDVTGVWCSEERFGLKYTVPRVVLHNV